MLKKEIKLKETILLEFIKLLNEDIPRDTLLIYVTTWQYQPYFKASALSTTLKSIENILSNST